MQLKPGAVSTCISIITSADNYIEMINFVSGPKGVCVGGGGGGLSIHKVLRHMY